MWTNETFNIVNTKLTNKDLVDNILEELDYNMDNVDLNQLKIGKYKTIRFTDSADYININKKDKTYTLYKWNEVMPLIKNKPKKQYPKSPETIKKDNKRRAVKYYNDNYPFLNITMDIDDDKFQEIKDNIWNIKKVIKLLTFFKRLDINEDKYNEFIKNI